MRGGLRGDRMGEGMWRLILGCWDPSRCYGPRVATIEEPPEP